MVSVRWHPPEQSDPRSGMWIVKAIRSDVFALILDAVAGFEVRIPLAFIERVEIEPGRVAR